MWDVSQSYQRVGLRGISLEVRLGAYAEERTAPQRISVDVDLFRHAGSFPEGRGLEACLNYDRIYRYLTEEWPRRGHTDLLEQLGEDLVRLCLQDERVEACRVVIRKPDIYKGKVTPELELYRRRA